MSDGTMPKEQLAAELEEVRTRVAALEAQCQQRGRCSIKSKPGIGTAVVVDLPVVEQNA
jgi:hypothetical protein